MLCVQYVYLFVCAFLYVCLGHNLKQAPEYTVRNSDSLFYPFTVLLFSSYFHWTVIVRYSAVRISLQLLLS